MSAETTPDITETERKRMAINGKARIQELATFAAMMVKHISTTRAVTDRNGRFMGLKMTIDRRALDAASDDLNTTLRPEFGAIDGMDTEAQRDAAARMKARIDSNLEDAGFEGMCVQIQLQPARARLVKVGL
jgi:hypothetical protein